MLKKKLIKYGWDTRTPDRIRADIRQMEQLPFDGITVGWPDSHLRTPFRVDKTDPARLSQYFDDIANIEWDKFTDNFLAVVCGDYIHQRIDWFEQRHWEAVEHNTKLVAKAARLGRCVGILFDPEDYGSGPWSYKNAYHRQTKSFKDYQTKVRQCGAAWMRIVQSELPNVKILFLFTHHPFPTQELIAETLPTSTYGLLPAFMSGMFDAAEPGVQMIDGNEGAYYYGDPHEYLDAYHRIAQRQLALFEPRLRGKYRDLMRVGSSIYVDWYFARGDRKVPGKYMTADQRLAWLEHNVYWSLETADEYVWLYSEHMDWWTGR